MYLPNATLVTKDNKIIRGNPTLTNLNGEIRASLETILSDSWTKADRESFGVYVVDTTPPEGKRWTGTFADNAPVFEDKPAPTSDEVNAERTRRIEQGHAFTVAGVTAPIPLQGRPQDQTVYTALLVRATGYKSAGITAPVLIIRDAVDTTHQLTPDQMVDLVGQAMLWFEQVMAASWALKDGTDIPADYTDDRHWP